MNSAAGRHAAPLTPTELRWTAESLRSRFPGVDFDADEERGAIQTNLLVNAKELQEKIKQYLQGRHYTVFVTREDVDEVGDHGYPTGFSKAVTFFRLWHSL
jgi:hypothetical protein